MKTQVIKFKGLNQNYSIFIGNNTLNLLPKKINAIVTNNSFTRKPIIELPILGPLLYLSCIL